MKKTIVSFSLTLCLLSFVLIYCKKNDDNQPTFQFEGKYTLKSAKSVEATPKDYTALFQVAIFSTAPALCTSPATPVLQLTVNANNTNSGNINVVCSSGAGSQSLGTWSFANNVFVLNVSVANPAGGSPIPTQFELSNLIITATQGTNQVTNVKGTITSAILLASLAAAGINASGGLTVELERQN